MTTGSDRLRRYTFKLGSEGKPLFGRYGVSGYDLKRDEFKDVVVTAEDLKDLIIWSGGYLPGLPESEPVCAP